MVFKTENESNCIVHDESNQSKIVDQNQQFKENDEQMIDPIVMLQIISLNQEIKQSKQIIIEIESEKEKENELKDKKINQLVKDNQILKTNIKKVKQDLSNRDELITENTKLKEKLKALKDSVLQLKERLDTDIYSKLELKSKLLKETLQINEQLEK